LPSASSGLTWFSGLPAEDLAVLQVNVINMILWKVVIATMRADELASPLSIILG
jgi:hypothetical protein